MMIELDFNSDEALYIQLRNQIIVGIATTRFKEGDALPSVRQLAEMIGINMHTVNKAYTVLKQEGYVKVDRRRGAVIAVDIDRIRAIEEMKKELRVLLAKGSCKNISREDWNDAAVYEEGGNGAFIGKADIKRVETELYRDRTYPVGTSQRRYRSCSQSIAGQWGRGEQADLHDL